MHASLRYGPVIINIIDKPPRSAETVHLFPMTRSVPLDVRPQSPAEIDRFTTINANEVFARAVGHSYHSPNMIKRCQPGIK